MSLSLQCPRCNGAVSVADTAAGQRVKCPHCDETFLAPGITATVNDDDDWLKLDEPPMAPVADVTSDGEMVSDDEVEVIEDDVEVIDESESVDSPAGATSAASGAPSDASGAPSGTPRLSDDDEALLAEFTSELDEFTAEIESPPRPHPSAAAAATSGGGQSMQGVAGRSSSAASKPAEPTEYATEYRVKCNICGTFVYAKSQQAGMTIKCPDCFSPITIPPPPKVRKGAKVNLDEAETFQFEPAKVTRRGPDPYKKSAEQLLREASQEEEEVTEPKYDDIPSVKDWVLSVFGIFKDLGVVVHWLGLSVLAGAPAALALHSEHPALILALFPGGFFLGVLVVSCGFAIMHAVANEEITVTEWPILDPFNWLSQLFVVVAAASLVVVPFWAVCVVIGVPTLLTAAIAMFSVYALFPFVLLSMLDMNSALIPFSAELARSITKCDEAWGGFYFSSGLLFAFLFIIYAICSGLGAAAGVAIAITATVAVAFAYFGMIGRLAFAIGQGINAPPRDDLVDRTRHNDVV